jgi:hypothetical protein
MSTILIVEDNRKNMKLARDVMIVSCANLLYFQG